jgi:hypothetical protein
VLTRQDSRLQWSWPHTNIVQPGQGLARGVSPGPRCQVKRSRGQGLARQSTQFDTLGPSFKVSLKHLKLTESYWDYWCFVLWQFSESSFTISTIEIIFNSLENMHLFFQRAREKYILENSFIVLWVTVHTSRFCTRSYILLACAFKAFVKPL